MDDEQLDRIIGTLQAHRLILQTLMAHQLSQDSDPARGARALKGAMADRFVDAPTSGKMDREREAKINHYAAHFLEKLWDDVEQVLAARKTKQG